MGLVGYTQLSIGIELEKKYSHRTQNPNELKRALLLSVSNTKSRWTRILFYFLIVFYQLYLSLDCNITNVELRLKTELT